jgi:cytochrome c peroxidase
MKRFLWVVSILISSVSVSHQALSAEFETLVFEAGHSSLQHWLLPEEVPTPKDNPLTNDKIELGKALFFDPRLSGDSNMSCATCHSPMFGWSDGLPTAKGARSMVLGRASPTVINTVYNSIQMWDGRKKSLEDQAIGPMMSHQEMNMDLSKLIAFLQSNVEYSNMFKTAYPDEVIGEKTLAKALASFERTVVSRTSPFDKWVEGDKEVLTKQQVNGFKLFVDPDKGNCAVCHSAPNFTENGFHNIGLASYGDENPDLGRYTERPLGMLKGAFKTPTVREAARTAPYFHDGSSTTLTAVVEHYVTGGIVKTNLSPNFKPANLSEQEIQDVVEFMKSLSSPLEPFTLPILPLEN